MNNLNYFKTNNNTNLPYSIELGKDNSNHIVILGGTHGNETAGIEAITNYSKLLKNKQINGKITFIIGNPEAYKEHLEGKENARFVDYNLNRAFIKNLDESFYEYKRMNELKKFIDTNSSNIKTILDLHSISKGEFEACVYKSDHPESIELAKEISRAKNHVLFKEEDLPGSLISYGSLKGIRGIAAECGNHNSPKGLEIAYYYINKLFEKFNIIDKKYLIKTRDIEEEFFNKYEIVQKIKPKKGMKWINEKIGEDTFGTLIKKGEAYAEWDEGELVAEKDYYIVMPSKNINMKDVNVGHLAIKTVEKY